MKNQKGNSGDNRKGSFAPKTDTDNFITWGRNPVRELLKSCSPIDKIFIGGREGSIREIIALAKENGVTVIESDNERLTRIAGTGAHQGVIAYNSPKEFSTVDEILDDAREKGVKPLIVIADNIEDPQNLGALIRCAECNGASGVIIPKRHSVGITPAVVKASAGAIWHMKIAKVTNIADTVEELKEKGLWIFSSEAGGTPYYETDFNIPSAVIFGSEGSGVSELVKKRSDFIVSIPMYGKVNSLNVSAAASVILSHAARMQREG